MWRTLFLVVALAACKDGPLDIPAGAGDPWGACSSAPGSEGEYACVELYGPAEGRDGWQNECAADNGTYSDHCPGGANPGCCVQGPAEDGFTQINCTYNCLDEICQALSSLCVESGGSWQ